jgi:hypothetical protein
MTWVEPEVAFEIRVQCTREEIEGHNALSPDNDFRDFDNMGGLTFEVYHVYKDQSLDNRMTYWYTIDRHEDCEFEFDIRLIQNHPIGHQEALQQALDSGLFYFDGQNLSQRCVDFAKDYRDKCKEARDWMEWVNQ